ncbi:MAG: hypothetical protein ACM3XZ_09845 [Betaproteobacteria bacterium]
MSASSDRRTQELLRRMEARLQDLTAGIARHEARAAELRQVKERIEAEREELAARLSAPASVSSGEPPATEETAVEPEGVKRNDRYGVKPGPPPEAEAVSQTDGFASEELWTKFRTQRGERRPVVIYPWSPAREEKAAFGPREVSESVPE